MIRRKRTNGLAKDIMGYGMAGAGLAVASNVVSNIGGSASAAVGTGIVKGASYMPAIASLIAAKHITRQVNKLNPRRKRRR
jgi:hypothetical protein